AHKSMNIPTIPGLSTHPRQVAERQRLAAVAARDPALADARQAAVDRASSISDKTATVVRAIADNLERARTEKPTVAPSAAASRRPDRRASATGSSRPVQTR
ncbi:MAG: hypothetical protein AAFQ11_07370, partial [Pseudomonadota bacterium]